MPIGIVDSRKLPIGGKNGLIKSLVELSDPERGRQIEQNYAKAMAREKEAQPNRPLVEIFGDVLDGEDDEEPCLICNV